MAAYSISSWISDFRKSPIDNCHLAWIDLIPEEELTHSKWRPYYGSLIKFFSPKLLSVINKIQSLEELLKIEILEYEDDIVDLSIDTSLKDPLEPLFSARKYNLFNKMILESLWVKLSEKDYIQALETVSLALKYFQKELIDFNELYLNCDKERTKSDLGYYSAEPMDVSEQDLFADKKASEPAEPPFLDRMDQEVDTLPLSFIPIQSK